MKNTLTLLIMSLFLFSCEKDPEINRIIPTNLVINFTQTVDSNRVVIGSGCLDGGDCFHDHSCCSFGKTLGYTNAAGENYNVQTLKYLISNKIIIKLVKILLQYKKFTMDMLDRLHGEAVR